MLRFYGDLAIFFAFHSQNFFQMVTFLSHLFLWFAIIAINMDVPEFGPITRPKKVKANVATWKQSLRKTNKAKGQSYH